MKNFITNFYRNTRLIHILILAAIFGILFPALVTGYILANKNEQMRLNNLNFMGQNTANNLSIALRGHMWDLREDLAKELIQTVIMHRDMKKIDVQDTTSNKTFVHVEKPSIEGENLLTFTKPIIHQGKTIGKLTLVLSDYYVHEDIFRLKSQFFYIFAGQLFVSLILIFLMLYYKVLKPLQRLNHQAVHFSKEDFSRPFLWKRNDEIGIVGKNFEHARSELLKAQEFALHYKEQLQKEVEAKTKELQELNENLEQRVDLELEKNKKQNILLQQQTRLAALGEMMGNIAHQWRQPLSAITTRASSVQVRETLNLLEPNEIQDSMEGIITSARFLSQTIDDFRDFLRTDKVKVTFDLKKTIMDIYNIIKANYESNGIAIDFQLDENITYNGYPRELSQVLLNILNNAKDALVTHDIDHKYVLLKCYKNDVSIIIEILDNGGGIPDTIINKIFDPYFTTKHQTQGTGIGLYMSMQIIQENFEGLFYVKNEALEVDGKHYIGAKFTIELPF